jgi:polar amino acid transport system substrate-binding protein
MKTSGAVGRAERRVDERYFRRTAEADFAPPLVRQEYSYLVPAGSSIRSIADSDRPGVRVAVLRNYASTVTLSRLMKKRSTPKLRSLPLNCYGLAKADAMASVRSLLAVALRKGQSGLLTYVSEFTAEAKASGLLKGPSKLWHARS